jgi:hypothetical protein
MRRAEALEHGFAHGLHLLGAGDVKPERQHLGAGGLHLIGGLIQSVLLHIDQHQVHVHFGAQASTLQAEARARTGQHRCFALEVCDHFWGP